MPFDPDAYLAANSAAPQSSTTQSTAKFDPDAYLAANSAGPQGPKTQGLFGTHIGENSPLLANARIPQTAAKAVSDAMMDATEPTNQSVLANAILRTPQTLASIGAAGVANTISPENVLTMAALKGAQAVAPAVNAVGNFIGKGAEAFSGLGYKTPGVLAEATNNPGLIFGKGINAARQDYQAAKGGVDQIRDAFKAIPTKDEFITEALKAANDGTLNPQEALEARKALDASKKTLNDVFYRDARDTLDEIAKKEFGGADSAYQQAVKSEALRSPMAFNKTGSPSIVKGALAWAKAPLAPFLSPAVQGTIASGIGVAKNVAKPLMENPETGAALATLLDKDRLSNLLGRKQ